MNVSSNFGEIASSLRVKGTNVCAVRIYDGWSLAICNQSLNLGSKESLRERHLYNPETLSHAEGDCASTKNKHPHNSEIPATRASDNEA